MGVLLGNCGTGGKISSPPLPAFDSQLRGLSNTWPLVCSSFSSTLTAELFEAAIVPSKETGRLALRELLAEAKIQRIGKGINRDPFRYFGG